jgi:myo-inositol-1(or 4)-monophosphatase
MFSVTITTMHTNYREVACALARQAGDIMLKNLKLDMAKEWKQDNTPLTVADTQINELVIATISEHFPDHAVLGEEGSHNLSDSAQFTWVLDPIDGTIPFSHGVPIFAFSLALTENGVPILGVIYDPVMDRLVVGEKDKGTTLNGTPVSVSTATDVNQTLIEVQSWRGYSRNLNGLKNTLIEQGAQATTICSVVYAGMLVAMGEYGGVIFGGTKPWDAAAVAIVVEEAGGKITDLEGNVQRYDQSMNGIVVSNGHLQSTLLALIATA